MRKFTTNEYKALASAIYLKNEFPPTFWLDAWEHDEPMWEQWISEHVSVVDSHTLTANVVYCFCDQPDVDTLIAVWEESPYAEHWQDETGLIIRSVSREWVNGTLVYTMKERPKLVGLSTLIKRFCM